MSVLGVLLFSSLGMWQVQRAQEKESLQSQINARMNQSPLELHQYDSSISTQLYSPVVAHGHFDPSHEILIDNEIYEGKPGYHVITPFILSDNSVILINRGWIDQGTSRNVLPEIKTPTDLIQIRGILSPPKSKPALVLAEDKAPGKVWLFLDLKKYENITGFRLMPVIIQMDSQNDYGFVRQWPSYDAKVWMHIGYAIHWFVFAIAVVIIYFVVNSRKVAEK